MKNHILVMTKFPRAGEVNTRMIPEIGAERAALVHQHMAEHTVAKAHDFSTAQTIVHITNCSDAEAARWLGASEYQFQKGDDLGERMANAVRCSLELGAEKVLVVGTDCPDINAATFEQAFNALDSHDVIYAPALDGGYVLIGMKNLQSAVFRNIDWGTEKVLRQSIKQLDHIGVSYHLLDAMQDVDFAQDIPSEFLVFEL